MLLSIIRRWFCCCCFLMYFPLFVEVLFLSLFCYTLLCVNSSFTIILKRKRKLVALLLLSYRCIVTINVPWLFLTVPWVGLQYVIVVFPDHSHLLLTHDHAISSYNNRETIYMYKQRPSLQLVVWTFCDRSISYPSMYNVYLSVQTNQRKWGFPIFLLNHKQNHNKALVLVCHFELTFATYNIFIKQVSVIKQFGKNEYLRKK